MNLDVSCKYQVLGFHSKNAYVYGVQKNKKKHPQVKMLTMPK